MKKLLQKFLAWLTGEVKRKLPPVLPDEKEKPAQGCNCDLKPIRGTPPYNDATLAAKGNAEECPTIGGRDIRLNVIRADGGVWSIGSLLPMAIVSTSPVCCRCFDYAGGRWHFLGYTHRDNHKENIVKAKAGDSFEYVTTTWVWYEWRQN
jgi:hypothetical protein